MPVESPDHEAAAARYAAILREIAGLPPVLDLVAMKSVVVDSSTYDWEGDVPLGRPSSHAIIYQMHVRF